MIRGCETSMLLTLATCIKAENNANAVKAAEAIAKPFPIAAVVLPTASKVSVRSLTSLGKLCHFSDSSRVIRDWSVSIYR